MSVAATALSVPALFALGLASSPHCALMCAPLAQLGSRPGHGLDTMRLHLGRLSAYMLLGAIAGALGGGILWQMERLGLLSGLRWAAAIGLVLLAGWRWRTPGQQPACCTPTPAAGRRLPAYVRGLLWGLLLGLRRRLLVWGLLLALRRWRLARAWLLDRVYSAGRLRRRLLEPAGLHRPA